MFRRLVKTIGRLFDLHSIDDIGTIMRDRPFRIELAQKYGLISIGHFMCLSETASDNLDKTHEKYERKLAEQTQRVDKIAATVSTSQYSRSPGLPAYVLTLHLDPHFMGLLSPDRESLRHLAMSIAHRVEGEIASGHFIQMEQDARRRVYHSTPYDYVGPLMTRTKPTTPIRESHDEPSH